MTDLGVLNPPINNMMTTWKNNTTQSNTNFNQNMMNNFEKTRLYYDQSVASNHRHLISNLPCAHETIETNPVDITPQTLLTSVLIWQYSRT